MTLNDWIAETVERYRTQPVGRATVESAHTLRMGAQRRVDGHIGTPIWADEWDVLLVLDACRPDQLAAVTDEYEWLPEEPATRRSVGSCSIDWINRTFNEHPERARETAYVTANPFADHDTPGTKSADLADGPVGHLQRLYRTHWQDVTPDGAAAAEHDATGRSRVGSGIATVPPAAVTDHTIAAARARDELGVSQVVAHYMQPHEPYRSHPQWGSGDSKLLENLVDEDAEAGSSVWPQAKHGVVDHDALWQAGVDNLRWVLDDIEARLLPNVDGRVVLTADHGNAMGEWGEWHHPPGALGPQVRTVPWVEIECTDSVTEHPDVSLDETAAGGVDTSTEARLEALGYR